MKAFIGEVNSHGLRRIIPEELLPNDALNRYTRTRFARPTSLVRALLEDVDAESLRAEVLSGRYDNACNLLLNLAVELVGLASIVPLSAPVLS